MFILTAREEERDNGCIVNTCFQVSENPTKLAISVQMGNLTRQMIENTGEFNISVLTEQVPFETIRHFGMQTGKEVDKFENVEDKKRSSNGIYYMTAHTNAMFSCKVLEKVNLGSHMMFIGEIVAGKVLSKEPSCTYAYYHKAIKPKL